MSDPEHGGHYSVKIYECEKRTSGDEGWGHAVVRLRPDSNDPRFEPLVFEDVDENELVAVAEFLQVFTS